MPERLPPVASSRATGSPKIGGAAGLGVGAVAALALALATAAIKPDEGRALTDYLDLAKVPTACFGHTGPDVQVGRVRTPAECDTLLERDVDREARAVARCVPAMVGRPYQWAAATRLAHNIGPGGFCKSGAATAFRRGQWRRGCDLFLPWNKARVRGQLVRVRGLALRRERERAQCLTGLPT